jgi:hypothetical protein
MNLKDESNRFSWICPIGNADNQILKNVNGLYKVTFKYTRIL